MLDKNLVRHSKSYRFYGQLCRNVIAASLPNSQQLGLRPQVERPPGHCGRGLHLVADGVAGDDAELGAGVDHGDVALLGKEVEVIVCDKG